MIVVEVYSNVLNMLLLFLLVSYLRGTAAFQGRQLQDGACLCQGNEEEEEVTTIRMLSPGGPRNPLLDFIADRFQRRVQSFYEKSGIKVDILTLGTLPDLNDEMFVNAQTSVYEGYVFEPSIVGALTEAGGLADLTDFVGGSQDLDWTDILPFNRNLQAIHDQRVRSIPCDGDIISIYYRKDIFDRHNLKPPRTWDEYTQIAKELHGREELIGGTNVTKKIVGSCVDRGLGCILSPYWPQLVHASTVQTQGTTTGMLFDGKTFKPNLDEAMAETLRHLEGQIKYGADGELDSDDCSRHSLFNAGECAMTYFWGNIFAEHAFESDVPVQGLGAVGTALKGNLGVAPTPGSTRVLDRDTGKLVNCTEEICPHGVTYPDIGRVNLAPYAAFGGWSVGVAGGLSKAREKAMADFFAHACGREESFEDVIINVKNPVATGADPFRKSQLDVEAWVAKGYGREATETYLTTIGEQLSSPNTVLDIRFPTGGKFTSSLNEITREYLLGYVNQTEPVGTIRENRLSVAKTIETVWKELIDEYDENRVDGALTLKDLYQKSFNTYIKPTKTSRPLSIGAIAGILVGCSFVIGCAIGAIVYVMSARKLEEERRLAEERAAAFRAEMEDDSDSECSVIVEEKRDEKAEIAKLLRTESRLLLLWKVVCIASLMGMACLAVTLRITEEIISIETFANTSIVLIATLVISFFLYDLTVRRRTNMVVENAVHANAIVSNMFPGEFRDKIFEDRDDNDDDGANRNVGLKMMDNFISDGGKKPEGKKPLADLFLNCTVMFADIVGFTAWSSAREPTQVFTLLETVFSKFDQIATRRGVVKVETVGDCYVAAVGLPTPRHDHAIVMCRFARDILKAMAALTKDLEISLGPDTGDLALRIGMHSGDVTGGILRGTRSRLQLFGDCMNVTARIESTGLPNRIHMSQECADLVMKGGKSDWVQMRSGKISLKGKGVRQTFWLIKSGRVGSVHSAQSSTTGNFSVNIDSKSTSFERLDRLIDWNTDQLLALLRQVIAGRTSKSHAVVRQSCAAVPADHQMVKKGRSLLDEVKEIVELPDFVAVSNHVDPDDVEIPDEVKKELRGLVMEIAALYRDNAFHNFEHASAVTLSVLKLLSRIVAPTDMESCNDSLLHDHTYGITGDPLTQFAVVFSAIIHDADHSGRPNDQLVRENVNIVQLYGNRSVAEQNSLVLCWELLMKEEYSTFRNALCSTQAELNRFRDLVINCVLATDIVDKDLKALRNARWDKAFKVADTQLQETKRDAVNRKATIVIEHLIQASDVSHTMQHWQIYRKWNERFFQECYNNFKTGRTDKDPSIGWYKGELGFFDFYIIPLAKKLKDCGVFGKSSDELLNYALMNRAEWEDRGEEVVSEMMEMMTHEAADENGQNDSNNVLVSI